MTTPKEVAQWMVDRLDERDDGLLQVDAVSGIEEQFGDEFTYISDIGEKSIDRRVLVIWVAFGEGFAHRNTNMFARSFRH